MAKTTAARTTNKTTARSSKEKTYNNPFVQKMIFEAGYRDVQTLFKEVYGHKLEIVADMEAANGANLSFKIDKGHVGNIRSRWIDEFCKTGDSVEYGLTRYLLYDLCDRGIIPPGKYIISIY